MTSTAPSTPLSYPPLLDDAAYDARELRSLVLRPHRTIDLVLVDRGRLVSTIARGRDLILLAAVLLATAVLASLPYGAVLSLDRIARVAVWNVGSVAICFPSLHVFGAYLGARNRIAQDLVLALLISAVAGLFAAALAPIAAFVRLTTAHDAALVDSITGALLAVSMLAGILYFLRISLTLSPPRAHRLATVLWASLLLFVSYRMGAFLGIP
jgi:hypothetical protein